MMAANSPPRPPPPNRCRRRYATAAKSASLRTRRHGQRWKRRSSPATADTASRPPAGAALPTHTHPTTSRTAASRPEHRAVLVPALVPVLASSEDPRQPHPRMTTPNQATASSPTKTRQTSSLLMIGAGVGMRPLPSPSPTDRDLAILHRLAEHEPLTTSELHLLFFAGLRTCQSRLKLLDEAELLCRVYPARSSRGGKSEPLWFLTPHGRRMI